MARENLNKYTFDIVGEKSLLQLNDLDSFNLQTLIDSATTISLNADSSLNKVANDGDVICRYGYVTSDYNVLLETNYLIIAYGNVTSLYGETLYGWSFYDKILQRSILTGGWTTNKGDFPLYVGIILDEENQRAYGVIKHYSPSTGNHLAILGGRSEGIDIFYDAFGSKKSRYYTNGGGCTHVAKQTGLLADIGASNITNVLIVSGGGGGGFLYDGNIYYGADAGGISGNGTNSGNQTTGNGFGQGEYNINLSGGGSGLYGGYKGALNKSGGAGSGYIGNSLLSNKKMVGYNVPTSSAEDTKTESVNVYESVYTANKPKAGNGHARIRLLNEIVETPFEQLILHSINQYETLSQTDMFTFPYSSADGSNLFYGNRDKRPLQYTDDYYYFAYTAGTGGGITDSAFAIGIDRAFVKSISISVGIFRVAPDWCKVYVEAIDSIANTLRAAGVYNYNHSMGPTPNILEPNTYYDFTFDVNNYVDYLVFLGIDGEWRFKDIVFEVKI